MRHLIICVLALVFGACNQPIIRGIDPDFSQAALSPEKKIVVAIIDGIRLTEYRHLPLIYGELAPSGLRLANLWNMGDTITRQGHGTILTGVYQYISNYPIERPHQPTFFEYLRMETSLPEPKASFAAGKTRLDLLDYSDYIGYGVPYGGTFSGADTTDDITYDLAVSVLHAEHPDFLMINFGEVDERGHQCVWENYLAAIDRVDTLVYDLWNELQSMPYYAGQTYLFITTDHGRKTTDFCEHGGHDDGCRQLLGIVLGPDVPAGVSSEYHEQTEFCRTFGHIMNVPTPLAEGHLIAEIFGSVSGIK